jgi:integrase
MGVPRIPAVKMGGGSKRRACRTARRPSVGRDATRRKRTPQKAEVLTDFRADSWSERERKRREREPERQRQEFPKGRGKIVTDTAAVGTNRVLERRKQELRFRDLVDSALEAKQLRGNEVSSIHTDRVRLRRVLPVIGHLKLPELTPGRIERFLQDLARGDGTHDPVKGATVNRFHSLLSSIFRYAVRQGFADVNPLAGGSIPRSKESPIHVRYLGRDEQRRLIAVIRRDCPKKTLEVELAILTGMRRGEQFNSKWEDWKVPEGVLYVMGKTGPRAVQISRAARRCLAHLRKRAPKEYFFITPERNDAALDRRLWFEKAVKKADLRPAFRYHDLRHTYCSRLVAAGVPLLEVQQLAGHKSYSTTLRYAHLSPDHRKRAVEKVRF